MTLSQQVIPLYGALAYYRLMEACDEAELQSIYGKGRLSNQLKLLIAD